MISLNLLVNQWYRNFSIFRNRMSIQFLLLHYSTKLKIFFLPRSLLARKRKAISTPHTPLQSEAGVAGGAKYI